MALIGEAAVGVWHSHAAASCMILGHGLDGMLLHEVRWVALRAVADMLVVARGLARRLRGVGLPRFGSFVRTLYDPCGEPDPLLDLAAGRGQTYASRHGGVY